MSLDKIKEAVLKASRAEAEHISTAAEKEAEKKAQAQKEVLRQEFEYQFQARARSIEEEYSRKIIQHQGAAAKDILEAKNAAIQTIFQKVNDIITAWSADEYRHAMQGFLERVTTGRGGKVRVHPEDREVFAGILDELNIGRSDAAFVELDETSLPEKGGFIFIGNSYEIDATLRTILGAIEQELLPEIAQDLSNI